MLKLIASEAVAIMERIAREMRDESGFKAISIVKYLFYKLRKSFVVGPNESPRLSLKVETSYD